MRPVLTAAEMRAADADAMATVSHEALVARAGLAAAIAATRLVPRVYGARVVVLCGPGSNGADGRVAARHLADRGARVVVVEAKDPPASLADCDLVVDAAFGTGLSRRWDAPGVPEGARVLAVDLPSGVDPDTGAAAGSSLRADVSVAMGSLKRGHLVADGVELSGRVEVASLGIDVRAPGAALLDDGDLAGIPGLARDGHKWRRALVVLAGSPGMRGAPALVCDAALAAQAGMVLLCVPDAPEGDAIGPVEAVRLHCGIDGAAAATLGALGRARAAVVGPGLGRAERVRAAVAEVVAKAEVPLVLDADALHAVEPTSLRARQGAGGAPVVLTPHDGEYAVLMGAPPGADRFAAAWRAAEATGCTVLLKGPTTVVASTTQAAGLPALLAVQGPADLATPGTGDVLSGLIGALLARGVPSHAAAGLAASLHASAASSLGARCRAGALPGAVARLLQSRRELDRGR